VSPQFQSPACNRHYNGSFVAYNGTSTLFILLSHCLLLFLCFRFAYQQLKGWRPILSAHNAELFLLAAGTLLLALGIPILVASMGVKEYSVRYDDAGPMAGLSKEQQQQAIWTAPDTGIVYDLTINVAERMEPPVRDNSQLYVVYFSRTQLSLMHLSPRRRFVVLVSYIFSLFIFT
jgi:hypothetical protein